MKIKKESEIPFYVILTGEIGNVIAWGGSTSLRKTKRIMRNPLAFRKGQWKSVVKFPNRKAAYESQYGPSLEIALGRFSWRPLRGGQGA